MNRSSTIISGKRYYYIGYERYKRDAERRKRLLKEEGKLVRLVRDVKGYHIYASKK